MSRRETTSGLADLLETYRDASTQDRVLWLSCAAAGVCVAGTAFWWLTRESYYSYVPLQVGTKWTGVKWGLVPGRRLGGWTPLM